MDGLGKAMLKDRSMLSRVIIETEKASIATKDGKIDLGSGDRVATEALISRLRDISDRSKLVDPYFPLKRWGKYVVSA